MFSSPLYGLTLTTLVLSSLLVSPIVLAQGSNGSLVEQAKQAQGAGNYELASKLWQQAIESGQKSAELYFHLGLSFHQQLDLLKAIQSYEQAIALDPEFGSAYLNEGLAWMEAGRYDKAGTLFAKTLEVPRQTADPEDTHTLAHYNLAIIHKREDNIETALREARAALEISPSFSYARELLDLLTTMPNPSPGQNQTAKTQQKK